MQVLLKDLLGPEDLCQEKLAGAVLQAYMLAPCCESQAAALTLLACMQPSCKLLRTLEVGQFAPIDILPWWTLSDQHSAARSHLLGCCCRCSCKGCKRRPREFLDLQSSGTETAGDALQDHLQDNNTARSLTQQSRGSILSFIHNAKQTGMTLVLALFCLQQSWTLGAHVVSLLSTLKEPRYRLQEPHW